MKLTVVGPTALEAPPTAAYTIEIETTMGDADGYGGFTMGPFKVGVHEEHLHSVLGALKRMSERFPYGMSGSDTYEDVPGYVQWFDEAYDMAVLRSYYPKGYASATEGEHEKFFALSEHLYKEWPLDPAMDNQSPQKLNAFKVFYYDHNSVKHDVEIDWED